MSRERKEARQVEAAEPARCPVTGGKDQDVLGQAFFDARSEDMRQRVKPKRFKHVQGVAETCERLAKRYDVNVQEARLAGLLHDWDKGFDDEGIRQRARDLGVAVGDYEFWHMPQVLHGPTAAVALGREYPAIPAAVLQAVARHTSGAVDMSDLDMIVYVADVIEPNRDFEGVGDLRALVCDSTLEELFLAVFQQVLATLIGRRRCVHPATLDIWNHYVDRQQAMRPERKRKD